MKCIRNISLLFLMSVTAVSSVICMTAIVKNFKKYHLFGFTGTPIFSVNSGRVKNPEFFTTGQTFGYQLHSLHDCGCY